MSTFSAPHPKRYSGEGSITPSTSAPLAHQPTMPFVRDALVSTGVGSHGSRPVQQGGTSTLGSLQQEQEGIRLGAMLNYRNDAVHSSLPPIKNQVFDLQTWKKQREIKRAIDNNGTSTTAVTSVSPQPTTNAALALQQQVGSPRLLKGDGVYSADVVEIVPESRLYYEPYVSSRPASEEGTPRRRGVGDNRQAHIVVTGGGSQEGAAATRSRRVGGLSPRSHANNRNSPSPHNNNNNNNNSRPGSKGAPPKTSSSSSRPVSPAAPPLLLLAPNNLVHANTTITTSNNSSRPGTSTTTTLLSPEACDYYNGNYLLSAPSAILANKHESVWNRPTSSYTHHAIIDQFKPNAEGNTTTIKALEMAALKFVEERYKPSRSVLYSDIPATATSFLPHSGNNNNHNSTAHHQSSPQPQRKKPTTRARIHNWRMEGGSTSWASEQEVDVNSGGGGALTVPNPSTTLSSQVTPSSEAKRKVALLCSHSQSSQRAHRKLPYAAPSFSPSTNTTLPTLYDHNYKEMRREAEILGEEQSIRNELYEGRKRDFRRRIEYVKDVMSEMEGGRFVHPVDKSLLSPTHNEVQVQQLQTLRREEVPVMFVNHEDDFPPGYFGESSTEEEESDDEMQPNQ